MTIYSGFSHCKWWLSVAMLVITRGYWVEQHQWPWADPKLIQALKIAGDAARLFWMIPATWACFGNGEFSVDNDWPYDWTADVACFSVEKDQHFGGTRVPWHFSIAIGRLFRGRHRGLCGRIRGRRIINQDDRIQRISSIFYIFLGVNHHQILMV